MLKGVIKTEYWFHLLSFLTNEDVEELMRTIVDILYVLVAFSLLAVVDFQCWYEDKN